MIARMKVEGWNWTGKSDPVRYARLRELIPDVPEDSSRFYNAEVIGELETLLPALEEIGIEPTIKSFKNTLMVGLHERIARLETQQKLVRQEIARDGILAQVHIPNVGMFLINEVQVIEDSCTDALQRELDDGWSILCVCPPNGQRRPDYILGRRKKELVD